MPTTLRRTSSEEIDGTGDAVVFHTGYQRKLAINAGYTVDRTRPIKPVG
jgi:hypothetical protein